MLLKKDFVGGLRATLIQDQGQIRNLESKIYLPGFHRFKFEFHSFFAETFSTVSATCRRYAVPRCAVCDRGNGVVARAVSPPRLGVLFARGGGRGLGDSWRTSPAAMGLSWPQAAGLVGVCGTVSVPRLRRRAIDAVRKWAAYGGRGARARGVLARGVRADLQAGIL